MNADWQFVLNETSVEVLLACKARQRELLLKALDVVDYLRRQAKRDDPQWQSEIGRRLDRCLNHQGHGAAELLRLHDDLSAKGL